MSQNLKTLAGGVMVDSHEIDDEPLVWSVIADAWDVVDTSMDPSKVTEALDRLPAATADLLAVDWCQKEVRNGGFEQFLANSTGVLAPRALLGFERIGGGHFANLLRGAMATLGEPYPVDHDTREEAVSLLPAEILDETLDALDD